MHPVFISYRQENDAHSARVRDLALRLEAAGLTVILDQLAQEREFNSGAPPNGWTLWSIQQAANTPSVLIIASDGWFRVINSPEPSPGGGGKGAAAEALTVVQRMYKDGSLNLFASIAYFDRAKDLAQLPTYLDICDRVEVTKDTEFTRLVTWLKRTPAVVPAASVPAIVAPAATPFPAAVPPVDRAGFHDCRAAFDAYSLLLSPAGRHRVLLLEGEGEHGKTTLLNLFLRHAHDHLPLHSTGFVRFATPASDSATYLAGLADAFGLPAPHGANVEASTRALLTARASLPTIIFFDAFEHATLDLVAWVSVFLDRSLTAPNLRLVLAGRRVPTHATQPWGIYAHHTVCDPFEEPEVFVAHAVACGSKMPPEEIHGCCKLLRSQRDDRRRKGQSTDGLTPRTLLDEINKRIVA